jgi:hypothetical protein
VVSIGGWVEFVNVLVAKVDFNNVVGGDSTQRRQGAETQRGDGVSADWGRHVVVLRSSKDGGDLMQRRQGAETQKKEGVKV